MKYSNRFKVIIVFVLLAAVLFAKLFKSTLYNVAAPFSSGSHQTIIDPNSPLIYTRHARCRMDCRHITEGDIREVLREGNINEAKSKPSELPCPTYAIEENRHSDGVRLRVVFAKSSNEVKVVTCIDRDHEFECDCK